MTKPKSRLAYVVLDQDVGRNYFVVSDTARGRELARGAINRHVSVVDCCGYFQKIDVGKRIYQVWTDAGDDWYLQIENDEQLERRLARGQT